MFHNIRPKVQPGVNVIKLFTAKMCFTWVLSGFTLKHKTRLERLAMNKHSTLLGLIVNYGRKKVL